MNGSQRLRLSLMLVIATLSAFLALGPNETAAQDSGRENQQSIAGADIFPETTAAFVQVADPARLIDLILQHPARQQIEQMEGVRKAMRGDEVQQMLMALAMMEAQIEQKWPDALKSLTRHGVYLGYDAKTNGTALVVRADDEAKLKRVVGIILNWAKLDAESKGNELPYKIETYRDFKIATLEGGVIGRWQTWFIISNNKELGKVIADSLLDGAKTNLANNAWFEKARRLLPEAMVWAAVDLDTVRSAGAAKELFRGKTDNPGVELVLGGVLDALDDAPFAVAALDMDRDLRFKTAVPFEANDTNDSRKFFFGEDSSGKAPQPLCPKNTVLNLIAHRDIAGWWLSKEDLFEENVIAELAQADSQLSTLFGGVDFGQEVLGAIKPGVQIVMTEQEFPDNYKPDVTLPAMALVTRLKDPKAAQRRFKLAYQSLIGILNINLGMTNQPQLELDTENLESGWLSAANYIIEEDAESGLILYNFSPSIAFQGEYFIISSTRALATELVELAAKADPQANVDTHTRLDFEMKPINRILNENREALITQNMIEEGNDREAAVEQVELLMYILERLQRGELNFQIKPDHMQLSFDLTLEVANPVSSQ